MPLIAMIGLWAFVQIATPAATAAFIWTAVIEAVEVFGHSLSALCITEDVGAIN